jgi:hypothetical protein
MGLVVQTGLQASDYGRNVGAVVTDLAVFARSHRSGAAFELATAPGVSAAKHMLAHRVYATSVLR